ncbi:MAG: hypothetical protein ABI681_10765 [Gemmatimonadales bacterium]
MKPLSFFIPLAAIAIVACSESNTGPSASLAARDGKAAPPPVTASGSLTNDMFSFDDGTFTASDGGTFTVDDLNPGGFGAAAPPLAAVYNASANKFIGRLDNHKARLIVPNGGSTYTITYDLYIIGSWDGNGKQSGKQYGVDLWENSIACTPNGQAVKTLLSTTFSNQKTVQQSYPDNYGNGGSKAGLGSFGQDALGFKNDPTSHTPQFESYGDTWYKMSFSGTNPCGAGNPLYLLWSVPNATLQSNYDESWGVDNVHIMTDS